ncbi:MAG: bifunctional 4-hydroxy-2-oxoglutarate aldolase/2-dehydro-3-deoxy-phosphogluconate aldolase [Bacteroidales bacterium]|nr:bifunctional 4-hydroxy-2-oxoglutarate aldolase/2-dehydro-3-deoxy-phosphogluconate aldolase [Bacteroidales bacterium]
MATLKRIEVVRLMKSTGIVPVFFHSDFETARNILQACFDGGVKVMEFTNRGDFAHEVFAELKKYVRRELPEFSLGVGSVMDAPTAALYMQIGADFVVSPVLDEATGRVCNRRKVLWIPGCGSVTEISKAHELGAEIVKIFPGSQVGGPGFVKAIRGPMPWTDIMPTGGVEPTEENLRPWFEAGVCSVGMGSKLITKKLVENGEFSKIKDKASEALSIVKKLI